MMASLIFSARLSNADTTLFRAWGSAVSTALGQMLTRVTQTGEINWTTVNAPVAANTFQGFEVYRLNDSLQSTAPLFFKFEYGSGLATAIPAIRLTIGKSVDGSGSVSNVLQSAINVLYGTSATTAASNCYISNGDGSGFVFSLQPDNPGLVGGFCCVERSRNSQGQPTADALMLSFQTYGQANHINRFIAYNLETTLAADNTGLFPCPLSLASDVGVTNGTVAQFFPVACIASNGATWRSRMLLGAARQNASLGQPAESILYGENYIGLGSGVQRADQRSGSFATYMIWWNP